MRAASLFSIRMVGWAALLSGILNLVGFVFLLLFFAIEAPQVLQSGEPTTPPLFGTLNDATFILVALLLLPVAFDLYQRSSARAPLWSGIALATGLVALPGIAAVQALYVPRLISTALQSPLLTAGLGGMGLWLLLVNGLGRSGTPLSGRLAWLGLAVGIGLLLMPVAYFAAGGAALTGDLSLGTISPFVVAGFGLAMLSLGIGYPIWAILAGRKYLAVGDQAAARDPKSLRGPAGPLRT